MYISTRNHVSSKGKTYWKGDTISNWTYFWLPRRDKEKFIKKSSIGTIVKPYLQYTEEEREQWRERFGLPSPPNLVTKPDSSTGHSGNYDEPRDHYGYVAPGGYVNYDPEPQHDNGHTHSHSHSHDSYSHDSYSDSGSYDSGYSSSDSTSCDSGGDCGGDCGGSD